MLTQEQETFLAKLADTELAAAQAEVERIAAAEAQRLVDEARAAKLADLQDQAQALITDGLQEFDTKVAPTITEIRV